MISPNRLVGYVIIQLVVGEVDIYNVCMLYVVCMYVCGNSGNYVDF